MEIGEKAMDTEKNKGAKWDGKSRVSNDLYRKNFDDIFKKEQDELKESYEQSKINKKEREELLKKLEDRNGF